MRVDGQQSVVAEVEVLQGRQLVQGSADLLQLIRRQVQTLQTDKSRQHGLRQGKNRGNNCSHGNANVTLMFVVL